MGKRRKRNEEQRFLAANAKKEILRFALPVAGSGFFQQAYSLFHAAVVSRSLSITAIAVFGACGAFVSMQSFVANGMTTGFGFYLSRCYGRGDKELYRKSFTAAIVCTAALFALSVLLLAGIAPLMRLAKIPEDLWEMCRGYLCVLILGTGFLGFRNLMVCVLQGMGESAFPGILTAAGVVSQTGILLAVLSVVPGMYGPPLAVLLNNALLGGILFFYLKKRYGEHAAFFNPKQISGGVYAELLTSGCSKSGMMILVGIGGFFMQRAQNTLSSDILAGSSLADSLSNFFLVPFSALAQTAGMAAGQNMGRKEYETVRLYNRRLLVLHMAGTVVVLFVSMTAGTFLIRLLAGEAVSANVVAAGELWLKICMPGFLGLGAAMICRNSLQSMGCYNKLICLGFLEMGVTVIFALFCVPRFGYPAYCASIAVKWTALGVAAGYWYVKKLRFLTR